MHAVLKYRVPSIHLSILGLFCSEILIVHGTHCSQIGHLGLFCSEFLYLSMEHIVPKLVN